jgi:cytochrome P450
MADTARAGQPGLAEQLLAGLGTAEAQIDPYPLYARLHALGPAHRAPSGAVFVTGYDDCAAVLRGPAFGAQSPEWHDRLVPGWRDHPAKVVTFEAMLFRDPPAHTRLRRMVAGSFTHHQVQRLHPDIAALTGAVLDRLADAGPDGRPVNMQQVLTGSLPISVIGALVGVPPADWPGLQESMSVLLEIVELGTRPAQLARANEAALRLHDYFAGLAAERRADPRGDLASALVRAARPGGRDDRGPAGNGSGGGRDGQQAAARWLTGEEVTQTLTFVFMAGVDTMINMLTNGTAALLAHPAQASALREDPGLGPGAVEEILRYDAPVQFVGRVASQDTTVGGVGVPADGLVVTMLGAANRDPGRFAGPDTFDIRRGGAAPLSFGGGIHHCLGAPLARMEAGTFFPALLRRFPQLRSAGEPQRRGVVFRGFSDLPVAVR